MDTQATIWTEGKTDWQHLKRAFKTLGVGAGLTFHEEGSVSGENQLLKQCEALARAPQPFPNIFLFDRDTDDVIRQVDDPDQGYKAWGNNVYSFAIPIPHHRKDLSTLSIEFYYLDVDLRTIDDAGRRLFVSTEFNPASGRLISEPRLSIGNKGKLGVKQSSTGRIVDTEVYDERSQNVALSKADFAKNVTAGVGAFGAINFEAFREIFQVIDCIISLSRETDLTFAGLESFLKETEELDTQQQFIAIVKASIRACKLITMTFIAATLRHYEQRILDESKADVKKVRPIKQILAQSFGHPALFTMHKLARNCYYLIDESAPSELHTLRAVMAATPTLGPLGDLFDDLEQVFPPPAERGRITNKSQIKKPVIDYILPEFAKYESRLADIDPISLNFLRHSDASKWSGALLLLLEQFAPLQSLSFRVRSIERVHNDSDEFDTRFTTYRDGKVWVDQITQAHEDIVATQLETYELLLTDDSNNTLDLFPFILIKGHKLHYYNRARPRAYDYSVVFGSVGHIEASARKFAHLALRTTIANDLQRLFWTQVIPTVSETGVKANLPTHGPIIGRTQQISDIRDEIIEIPNQNGIVYGPGGVGKTALLLEISRQLLEASPTSASYFQNIVWVSAKPNYYDPTLDLVEAQQPQFQSLDNVLAAILEFHEIDDANTYTSEDKKYLVLELLQEERTLLILDNFESVAPAGQGEIRNFFGVTVKKTLRDKPDFFKVLITSRELIPSGFHQIKLMGLDEGESKQLMNRLYELYAHSGRQQLTDTQQKEVYEATRGIPLIIKHCYGQIYEYTQDPKAVVEKLSRESTRVVDFSFAEVFDLLKSDDLQLRIILLLELSGPRLMARQIAEILLVEESEVRGRLSQLVNFQCASIMSTGAAEKYGINDEVRFLTRRLTLEYGLLATEIKRQIAKISLDKRMDYTQDEFDAVVTFEDYISQNHYLLAEGFVTEQLKKFPNSVLLNLHYAKYLKEVKRRPDDAIDRLRRILEPSGYDQQILRLLMAYYIELEIPNFEQAHAYARELEGVAATDVEIKGELARFYVAWSTALKMKRELDPLKEKVRQQTYKELADKATHFLEEIDLRTHEWHYLMAQSYFNSWDYDLALEHIDKAIGKLPRISYMGGSYNQLQYEIRRKRSQFGGRTETLHADR